MKRIIIILAFLVCGISSAQQYFFNGTVYVPKTTVQINAIVSPPEGRVEANSDTGSLWYFDGTIWKDTFVGVSSFEDLEGDPYDNAMLSDALNSKANDSVVVKVNPNSLVSPLTLAVSDSTTIASGIFTINDIVIDTTTRTPGGDEFITDGNLSGAGVLTLNRNYGSPIQIPGFNSGSGYLPLSGGTMSGGINAGGQNITNIAKIQIAPTGSSNLGWEMRGQTTGNDIVFLTENSPGSGIFTPVKYKLNDSGIPTDNTDVVNKGYVDSAISAAISGATGTFTSQDGKTITVTNGLITNISTP